VVELALDNGVVGLGDTWGTPEVFAMARSFAKGWIGKDALDRFALRNATLGKSNYDNKYGRNGRAAFAGLDLAAWDAAARSLKRPLAELIGARKRESIDVVSSLPRRSCQGRLAQGLPPPDLSPTRSWWWNSR
jgi:L-alanine-DL-glutamate epimerase-like enolase superfamily enzyme